MSRKKVLITSVASLGILGVIIAATPFMQSLNPSAKAKSNIWKQVNLRDLKPGEIRDAGFAWIYRRTDIDYESYQVARGFYISDNPLSSELPLESQNQYRSSHKDYFIFFPNAPRRGCPVDLFKTLAWEAYHPDQESMKNYPHFSEPCEGRIFDTTGRVLKRPGYPPEGDLRVPQTRWRDSYIVEVRRN